MATLAFVSIPAYAFVYHNDTEMYGAGLFDTDGLQDVVVVDRVSGAYRMGYQRIDGTFHWDDVRASGIDKVCGFTVGHLFETNRDAMAFSSAEANRINLFDAEITNFPGTLVTYIPPGIGPQSVLSIDIGGVGNTTMEDLFVGTMWNDATNNTHRIHLIRNDGTNRSTITSAQSTNLVFKYLNRVVLRNDWTEHAAGFIVNTAHHLRVYNPSNGTIATSASFSSFPTNSRYIFDHFNPGTNTGQFIVYQPGETNFNLHRVISTGPGSVAIANASTFNVTGVIDQVFSMEGTNQLMIIFQGGTNAAIYDFNAVFNFQFKQRILSTSTMSRFMGLIPLPGKEFVMLTGLEGSGITSGAEPYTFDGGAYTTAVSGAALPSVSEYSGRGNVLVFEDEPFVDFNPHKLAALHTPGWSASFKISGSIQVTNETDRGVLQGLGDPISWSLGSPPAGAAFGLVNQHRPEIASYNLDPALGEVDVTISISPDPGEQQTSAEIAFAVDPTNAQVYYNLDLQGDWVLVDTNTTPFTIFKDTTVYYYGISTNGTNRTAVSSATYEFEDFPDELDSDGDGVPDYVELAHGLDPVESGEDADGDGLTDLEELLLGTDPGNPDSDGDGWSDMEELRAGRDPLNSGDFPASNDEVLTNDLFRIEKKSSFDLYVTPRPYDGTVMLESLVDTGVQHRAYDLAGEFIGFAASTSIVVTDVTNPAVCIEDLDIDVPLCFVALVNEQHYPIDTGGADKDIGREMVGLFLAPEAADIDIFYFYAGGELGEEASNWVSAATSAWANVTREVQKNNLTYRDTLAALLAECKLGEILFSRAITTNNQISLFSARDADASRTVPTIEQIKGLQYQTTNEWPAYDLKLLFGNIETQVHTSVDSGVADLRELTKDIYRLSSASNNATPGSYPLPVDTIRSFLKNGQLIGAYSNFTSRSSAELTNAFMGAGLIMSSCVSRTVMTLDLRVDAFFGFDECVTLCEVGGFDFWSLFDSNGLPYRFPQTFVMIQGSEVEVTGYTDIDAAFCSGSGIEVDSVRLTAIPTDTDEDNDANFLPDSWELLVFGMTGNISTNDSDGDGYSDLQEYLEGTDPTDDNSTPGGAMEDLSAPPIAIDDPTNVTVMLTWNWPEAYQDDFNFSLECTENLTNIYLAVTNAVVPTGGMMTVTIPQANDTTSRFYRLIMSLK